MDELSSTVAPVAPGEWGPMDDGACIYNVKGISHETTAPEATARGARPPAGPFAHPPVVCRSLHQPSGKLVHSSLGANPCAAGPLSTVPSVSKREPWQGQSQLFASSFQRTRPPRCGHTADKQVSAPAGSR